MIELLIEYKGEILNAWQYIARILSTFAIALAVVYLLGRMFTLIKTPTQKNFIALGIMLAINFQYAIINLQLTSMQDLVWSVAVDTSLGILLYVLLGFKLYDRVDSLLDKKLGEDKPLPKTKRIK